MMDTSVVGMDPSINPGRGDTGIFRNSWNLSGGLVLSGMISSVMFT